MQSSGRGDWLVGGGEMAKVIKAKDWAATALGPMESWPQSLRTTVSLVQASSSPISLAWGPGHVQIYNDGYWPICGEKHPVSLGQDFRECWASAFPVIGEAYATAWSGRSAYLEKVRMFLDRFGFLEETWFTFSFSPITDESGRVGGLFHPVTEMTAQMLSERRTKILRDLASRAGKARSSHDAFVMAAQALAEAGHDLPFVLFYLLDSDHRQARLIAQAGMAPGLSASPLTLDLSSAQAELWRIASVARTGLPAHVEDAAQHLFGLTVGPYPEPPTQALALPIAQPGSDRPVAVMVAGMSSRLHGDEAYRAFFDLVATASAAALANARAYEEERERAERLAELDRAKTTFFSNVSHEFRTPLTLILGPVEDALALPEKSLEGASLLAVHRSAVRLSRLVNNLLDFARIEAGRLELSFAAVDLARLTTDLVSSFRSLTDRANLQLTVSCEPLPAPVYVDAGQWEKIVLNLVSNAFKFTLRGEIAVSLRKCGGQVELTVRDTGIGIPARDLPRIFERFHRVEGAKGRSFEGTGIGLSMVQELARLHGGSARAESVEGEGSSFTVSIPMGSAHISPERLRDAAPHSTSGGLTPYLLEAQQWLGIDADDVPDTGSELVGRAARQEKGTAQQRAARVLVADDNADMRAYLVRLLAPRFRVDAVADGEAALAAARAEVPDLVLSDVMMPKLDGFGLLRALRADSVTRQVPVVLLSARAGEEAVLEGLETGADDYLVKPFSARELLARVRAHLDMGRLRGEWARELARANQELEAFSYSVSHDLRTPLRAIDGFSKVLLEDYGDKLDAEGLDSLKRVRGAAQRMDFLIDDLLRLSRLMRAAVRRDRVDLALLARDILKRLGQEHDGRAVEVSVQEGLVAHADAGLAAVLLDNLLGNAWKFTAKTAAARIEVGAERQAGEQVFFVRDNGAGFDMQLASHLFAPFRRLHDPKQFAGTGIGLATAQRVVARHGGRIWAEGAEGRGATFFFTLGEST